jgi:hypothetical protein
VTGANEEETEYQSKLIGFKKPPRKLSKKWRNEQDPEQVGSQQNNAGKDMVSLQFIQQLYLSSFISVCRFFNFHGELFHQNIYIVML